jgi:hypothetical protein
VPRLGPGWQRVYPVRHGFARCNIGHALQKTIVWPLHSKSCEYTRKNPSSKRSGNRDVVCGGTNAVIAALGLKEYFGLSGKPCWLICSTLDANREPSQEFRTLFLQETVRRGVFGGEELARGCCEIGSAPRARSRSFVDSIFANPEFVWIETLDETSQHCYDSSR